MANLIGLIQKYAAQKLDEVFAAESKTALLENGTKWIKFDFTNAKEVRIPTLLMDGLSNYYRVNHIGVANSDDHAHYNGQNGEGARDGYAIGNASLTWKTYTLRYDRAKQFLIDNMDDEETAGLIIGNLYGEFYRLRCIPEVDAVRFATIAGATNATLGNRVVETTANLTNAIIASWNRAFAWLAEHEIPEEDQILFVNPQVYALVKNSTELTRFITQQDFTSERGITFKLPAYEGRPIVEVPTSRFYDEVVVGANGYYPTANAKTINYIVASKRAIVPVVKLAYNKVFTPDVVQDYNGYKVNVRIYHDCFIPENKIPGVYVSVNSTAANTQTAKLELALVEGAITNAYAVKGVYTLPTGLLGKVVAAATAFTLGTTVEVDGEDVVLVDTTGGNNVDATNSALYFALIDGANRVIATSGQITLPKKA